MAEGRRCGKGWSIANNKVPWRVGPVSSAARLRCFGDSDRRFGQVPLDLSTEHAHPCAYMGSSPRSPSLSRVVWLFPHDGAHLTSIIAAAAVPQIALTTRCAAWCARFRTGHNHDGILLVPHLADVAG